HARMTPGLMVGVSEGSQGSELERASSQSVPPSFSKMSQNARESMGVLGEGLKQLFQQQRKRLSLSHSTIPSSHSFSSSSVISPGGTPPLAPEDTFENSLETKHLRQVFFLFMRDLELRKLSIGFEMIILYIRVQIFYFKT
uniref:Uncharacterized protein n=1 Tax=Kryptolebias marmoratus TaxID=37003 RepID=A0A3Q3AVW3_KRYMA